MAGAGYKLFSTGDVLSASDVNTYLQQQTVMVFASAAARTTALASVLAEGMVTYLKDTDVVEIYTGAAWVSLDDPNAIQNSIVDAKGDLIAATADNTPARLAVGANDLLLTAASGEATGLKYTGAWTSFTPTLTNMVLGNGTASAKYCQIGKVVFVFFSFVFGSTSTMSNYPGVTLPIAPVAYAGLLNGNVYMLDSATAEYYGTVYNDSGVRGTFFAQSASGSYVRDAIIGASVPMTWTTNDKIQASFWYEVA